MAYIDLTSESIRGPGDYPCEVMDSVEQISSGGHTMFLVKFKTMEDGRYICTDRLMLAGAGASIGHAKLRALGYEEDFKGDIAAAELMGKRVMLHLVVREYQGTKSLDPDIKQGEYCGYSRLTTEPVQAVQDVDVGVFSTEPPPPEELPTGEGIPF